MAQLRTTSYLRELVARHLASGSFPPAGTVTLWLAYAKVAEVSGPGVS